MDSLNLISVVESAETTLQASSAELTLRISGQSFFTGTQAFKKAVEVKNCVEALKGCGIEEADISLQNVSASVDSGFLIKTSSATYHLLVICKSLENLGPALAAISAQKHVDVERLHWKFDAIKQRQKELLEKAVKSCKATALSIAESLGSKCVGVHKLKYEIKGGEQIDHVGLRSHVSRRSRGSADFSEREALEQMNLKHTTELKVIVSSEFMVSSFS